MKNPRIAFTLLAAALAIAGCGKQEAPKSDAKGSAAPAPAAATEVKIASVAPLTVKTPHLGKDNENGVRLAVEEANAAKLKIDGKDAKFVLVSEDDQGDPKVGTTVAQKLVDAKVAGGGGGPHTRGTTSPSLGFNP